MCGTEADNSNSKTTIPSRRTGVESSSNMSFRSTASASSIATHGRNFSRAHPGRRTDSDDDDRGFLAPKRPPPNRLRAINEVVSSDETSSSDDWRTPPARVVRCESGDVVPPTMPKRPTGFERPRLDRVDRTLASSLKQKQEQHGLTGVHSAIVAPTLDRVNQKFHSDGSQSSNEWLSEEVHREEDIDEAALVQEEEERDDRPPLPECTMSFARWNDCDTSSWVCKACTYVNEDMLHLSCAVCFTKRDVKEDHMQRHCSGGDSTLETSASTLSFADEGDDELDAIERERLDELIQMQFDLMEDYQTGEAQRNPAQLSELSERMSSIVQLHNQEKEDQTEMMNLQMQRKSNIEEEEGQGALSSVWGDRRMAFSSQRPVSSRALEWMGQQRMLDEWQMHIEERDERLERLQREQERLWQLCQNQQW